MSHQHQYVLKYLLTWIPEGCVDEDIVATVMVIHLQQQVI